MMLIVITIFSLHSWGKGRGKGLEEAMKMGLGRFGRSDLTADNDIAIELITLDFLRGALKHGNTEIQKERMFEFFKSDPDVCKPTPCFRKRFKLDQKSLGEPGVPQQLDVFAAFSPVHLAIVFLADMKDLEEKTKLVDILNQRMIQDKEFARDVFFTEVDNEDLFNKVC